MVVAGLELLAIFLVVLAILLYKSIGANVTGVQMSGSVEETFQVILDISDYNNVAYPADITASISGGDLWTASFAGEIIEAGLWLNNTGADGTDALSMTLNIKLADASSIFTTTPALTKAASDKTSTFASGTGITVGVIDTGNNSFALDEDLTFDLTLVRTTPEDEMAGPKIFMTVQRDVTDHAD